MFRAGIKHPVRGWDASVSAAVVRPLILPAIKTLTLAGYSEQSPTHANANLRSDPTPERTQRGADATESARTSSLPIAKLQSAARGDGRCPADCQSAIG